MSLGIMGNNAVMKEHCSTPLLQFGIVMMFDIQTTRLFVFVSVLGLDSG